VDSLFYGTFNPEDGGTNLLQVGIHEPQYGVLPAWDPYISYKMYEIQNSTHYIVDMRSSLGPILSQFSAVTPSLSSCVRQLLGTP
jgi:hypothetical protein